ncbi:MAG: RNA polymerase sigma factor [Chloroflexota bacterium]
MKGTKLDLVRRAQRGDHDAFDELVDRHGPELYRLAVAMIGQAGAADVTQDAFLRAWRELPTLHDPDRFLPWTRRILVNLCRDAARAERRRVRPLRLDAIGEVDQALTVPDPSAGIDRSTDLRDALATLSHAHRTVLVLHYVLDLPIREVAASLGVPGGTAKSRLNAALAELRRRLSDVPR